MPTAYIIGGPDLHVDKGSTINLTCSVKYSQEPPAYIFWFHQDEVSMTVLGTHLFALHSLFTGHPPVVRLEGLFQASLALYVG